MMYYKSVVQMLDFGSGSSSDEESSSENQMMFGNQDEKDFEDDDEDLTDDELFEKEFLLHKRNYYINKMKYSEMTQYVLGN